jgi:hypothetical protein
MYWCMSDIRRSFDQTVGTSIVCTNLRTSSPEPAKRIRLTAVSAITEIPRNRSSLCPPLTPQSARRNPEGCKRDSGHAGITPKQSPVASETPRRKPRYHSVDSHIGESQQLNFQGPASVIPTKLFHGCRSVRMKIERNAV